MKNRHDMLVQRGAALKEPTAGRRCAVDKARMALPQNDPEIRLGQGQQTMTSPAMRD